MEMYNFIKIQMQIIVELHNKIMIKNFWAFVDPPNKIKMFPKALHQVVQVQFHLAGYDHVVLGSSQPY